MTFEEKARSEFVQSPGNCPSEAIPVVIDRTATDKETSSPAKQTIPLISYFTGAGLLDLGFIENNFNVIWRNELNPSFVDGFEYAMSKRLGDTNHKVDDKTSIEDLSPVQVINKAFHNTGRPETFGIIGGPPCTDFSVAGKNHGEHGKNGKLAEIYVNHILQILPSFFVLENVRGLFQNGKHRSFLDKLIARLNEHYITDAKILNALEFGVPQDRERGFLVGFNKNWLKRHTNFSPDVKSSNWFPWSKKKYNNPKKLYMWPGRVPFGSEPVKPEGIPDELVVGTWIYNPEVDLTLLPNGLDQFRPKSNKFHEIDEGDDTRKSFKRLHRWRYSPTAAYGNNEVHLHPVYPRRLSVREVMRIQSVPDWYALPDDLPLCHKYKMIGNGVPVKLAKAVAASVAKITNGEYLFGRSENTLEIQQALFFDTATCTLPQLQEEERGHILQRGFPDMHISAVKSNIP